MLLWRNEILFDYAAKWEKKDNDEKSISQQDTSENSSAIF